MVIYLAFADSISEAFRVKLQTFLDAIIAKGSTESRPPRINFTGMNDETFYGIKKLQRVYDRRFGLTSSCIFGFTF